MQPEISLVPTSNETALHMTTIRTSFLPSTTLASVSIAGPYAASGPRAWQILFTWLERSMHHTVPGRGFGMTFGDPRVLPPEKLKYVAGVEVPKNWLPADQNLVALKHFEGGAYLLREHIGPYSKLGSIKSEIRNVAERRPEIFFDASRPLVTMFLSDPRVTQPDEQFSHVCVPILAERRSQKRVEDRLKAPKHISTRLPAS